MTTTYVHLTDTDKPESQTAITASFVDKDGKHIDIGGGGTSEIHTDDTLAGTGTTDNPLKLSDSTTQAIEHANTITEDNIKANGPIQIDRGYYGCSEVVIDYNNQLFVLSDVSTIVAKEYFGSTVFTVPAITALKSIATLDSSASLTDVINKVNEILNAVKNPS